MGPASTLAWIGMAAVLALALIAAQPVRADYEAGQRAWDAGQPAEALAQWQATADGGDPQAMLALGRLYEKGLGAPQNYVLAHMWFNLAASRGEVATLAERDAVAAKMTPQQIATAQERASSWRPASGGVAPAEARDAEAAPAAATEDAGPPPVEALREAQTLLTALGYEPGPADGIWGGRSVQAYQAFLRDAGLPAAATLTPQALRAMRTIAKRQGAGTDAAAGAGAPQPTKTALPPDALHRAAKAGDIDGLKAALAAGAEVNARDGQGWTALMHAANKGYTLLLPPLLEAKADPDIQAADGATALFMAAALGHSEIIALLMKAGADTSVRGPKGKTAVDLVLAKYGDFSSLGFRDCAECPEMVVVPAGSFTMGSPPSEKGRGDDEGPQHPVTIPAPFAVGKYEVTFEEWDACVAGGGICSGDWTSDKGWGRGQRPMIDVSWGDAKAYVAWLWWKTNRPYRLLTEAEWEYAARAGTTGPFHFGSTISTDQANYNGGTHGSGRKGVYRKKTVPVGSFPANKFGLHDMRGNVQEWVEDCWHSSYDGAPSDGSSWGSGGDCGVRVLRGGSWNRGPWYLRAADRFRNPTWSRIINFGFRIARTLTP